MRATVYPSKKSGTIAVPPSKSAAHRAIICACLADGVSVVRNVSESEDMKATIGAMEALGARIERNGDTLTIRGTNGVPAIDILRADCRESGSTLRFLIPLFALCGGMVTLTGSKRLMERPQDVYEALFEEQGLFFARDGESVRLKGKLKGGDLIVRGDISSQFITGLLFTLPLLEEDSVVHILPPFESASYVALTLKVLEAFGIRADFADTYTLRIPGRQKYQPRDYTVEGDFSQLAFWAVRGAIGAETGCNGVKLDTTQGDKVILDHVAQVGANVSVIGGNAVVWPGERNGCEIDLADCPDLGPILTVLGAFCNGEMRIINAGRLRVKESDRIEAMETELKKLGVHITSTADTITVDGREPMKAPVTVQAHNDHRIAMSLAIFAASAEQPVTIEDAECVKKSYPDFFEVLRKTGVQVECEAI